ncbi:hypothetical protein [Shewanella marina]|uniref:hypothetical protein n=1 Tax=Shewanella marina TaxID=487319 RepID=UPI0004708442|nr:hypothetical protein [Shewanella marina]
MKTRYIAIALLLSPSLAFANTAEQPVPTEIQSAPTSMMVQPQMMAESAATSQQTNPQQMNVQPNMMQATWLRLKV